MNARAMVVGLAALGLGGCASYEPRALSPQVTAAGLNLLVLPTLALRFGRFEKQTDDPQA